MEKQYSSSYFQCQVCNTFCLTAQVVQKHVENHREDDLGLLDDDNKIGTPWLKEVLPIVKVTFSDCHIPLTRVREELATVKVEHHHHHDNQEPLPLVQEVIKTEFEEDTDDHESLYSTNLKKESLLESPLSDCESSGSDYDNDDDEEFEIEKPKRIKRRSNSKRRRGPVTKKNGEVKNAEDKRVKKYLFSCHLCPAKFLNKKDFDLHINGVHNGWRKLMACCICGRIFNKRDSLNTHLLCHQQAEVREEKYKLFQPWGSRLEKLLAKNGNSKNANSYQMCKICLLHHSTHYSYLHHFLQEHSNPPENFRFKCRCDGCDEGSIEYRTIRELVEHCKIKHPLDYYGKLACSKRGLQFRSSHRRRRNGTTVTSGSTGVTLMCGFCAYPAENGEELEAHIEKSHPRRFQCHCSLKFATEENLRAHVQEVHEQKAEKQFKCKFCKKSFLKKFSLRHHLRKQHEENGERKVTECHICKKKYSGHSIYLHLKRHEHAEKVRRGEKVFRHQCMLCKCDYATSGTLKRHINTMHFMKTPDNSVNETSTPIHSQSSILGI